MIVALAQINVRIGDIQYNKQKIISTYEEALSNNADIIVYPELAITGYLIQDMIFDLNLIQELFNCLLDIIKYTKNKKNTNGKMVKILLGSPSFGFDMYKILNKKIESVDEYNHINNKFINKLIDKNTSKQEIFNSAFLIENGKIITSYNKYYLPNYKVFDENRYFISAFDKRYQNNQEHYDNGGMASDIKTVLKNNIFKLGNNNVGILICEDMWHSNIIEAYHELGCNTIISINASPFSMIKSKVREDLIYKITQKYNMKIIYVNQIGGQDHIVFDGGSAVIRAVINGDSEYIIKPKFWKEEVIIYDDSKYIKEDTSEDTKKDTNEKTKLRKFEIVKYYNLIPDDIQLYHIYSALLTGIRDYFKCNNFKKAILGLSGGIDSAVVATIVADAIGPKNILCVALPSRFSSNHSMDDALDFVKTIGCEFKTFSIIDINSMIFSEISSHFVELDDEDVASQNLQSRIRGMILMTIANKAGKLLLNTGNKSESAMGYTTLYGDMCGGLAPIADLYKTQVYKLIDWRNKLTKEKYCKYINIPNDGMARNNENLLEFKLGFGKKIINDNIMSKSPSAELKDNQFDQDTLFPYDILDEILFCVLEKNMHIEDVQTYIAKKFKSKIAVRDINNIITKLMKNEFKRAQTPCGLRVSECSLRYDKRWPIGNLFYKG